MGAQSPRTVTSFITETDKLKGLERKEKSEHLGRKNLTQPMKVNDSLLLSLIRSWSKYRLLSKVSLFTSHCSKF